MKVLSVGLLVFIQISLRIFEADYTKQVQFTTINFALPLTTHAPSSVGMSSSASSRRSRNSGNWKTTSRSTTRWWYVTAVRESVPRGCSC